MIRSKKEKLTLRYVYTKQFAASPTPLKKLLLRQNQKKMCHVIFERRHKFVKFAAFTHDKRNELLFFNVRASCGMCVASCKLLRVNIPLAHAKTFTTKLIFIFCLDLQNTSDCPTKLTTSHKAE